MKKCKICQEEFDNHGKYANHIRWNHKETSYYDEFKKDMSKITTDYYIKIFGEIKEFDVICNNCGKEFKIKERETKRKNKYFCSRSCANTRHHNKEIIDKIKIGVKNKWKNDDEYAKKCIRNFIATNRFSSKGERELRKILKKYYGEKDVSAHRIIKLSNNEFKAVDIKIKKYNTIIEYDGEWHFNEKLYEKLNTKENLFFKVKEKERLLKSHCETNNIKLLRVSDKIYNINKEEIIGKIKNFIENPNIMYVEIY